MNIEIKEYWRKGNIIGWSDICRPNRPKIFLFVQYSLFFNIHLYMIWHFVLPCPHWISSALDYILYGRHCFFIFNKKYKLLNRYFFLIELHLYLCQKFKTANQDGATGHFWQKLNELDIVNESSFFKLIHCKFLKFENGQNGRPTRSGDFELFGPVDLSVQLKFFKEQLSKLHKKYSLRFGFKSK